MGIAVLGPLTIDGVGGLLRHHDRVVLTVLAVRPGEPVSADRLADALWGDSPPETWSKVVQGCVVRLRKVLGTESIETTPQGYRLTVHADEVDSHRFERLLGRGREHLALSEPERAVYVLAEAIGLWRGPAFTELNGWPGGRVESARLDELHRDAEELRVDAALRAGQAREVLGDAQRLVGEAPLRERRWALLALAQYQAGQQAQALRTIRKVRTVLANELGLDPGSELVALEQAILRQDPSSWSRRRCPSPTQCAPIAAWCPTASGTPTPSLAARRRWPSACAGWRRAACSRSWDRPAAASRRWSGPAWPRRLCARGNGCTWSHPDVTRSMSSTA